jgi:D-3-phosphoglycerate dehydrogenase
MNIIIPDDYQDAVRNLSCFDRLADHSVSVFTDTLKNIGALAERLQSADALVLIRERTRISEELLARLPRLKLISQTGKGTAHIDLAACTRRGIVVSAGTGSPFAPAELTWALVLASRRHVAEEAARMRAGFWQSTLGKGLRGQTLGVWGYGKIGSLVARYGRAFSMNVLVWGRAGSLSRAQADGYAVASSQKALLEESDILSLHLKLTEETTGILTAPDLARMKPDALLVNTSRAELIEPRALETALRAGRPGFAAVDVYEGEPILGATHPFLDMDNVLCTPHLGYVERDCYEQYFGQAFDQVIAFDEQKPVRVVNLEVLGS